MMIAPCFWRESCAAVATSLIMFTMGTAIGWTSPAVPSLQADPVFKEMITKNVASWIGSLFCLGTIFGTVITTFLIPRIGPKLSLLLAVFPLFLLSWCLLLAAPYLPHIWMFYTSRLLSGCAGGAGIATAPGYIIDIASPQYQGILGLAITLFCNLGLLAEYILGAALDWWWTSLVSLLLMLPFLAVFPFMPDSPPSLTSRGKTQAAAAASKWLRHPEQPRDFDEMTEQPPSTPARTSVMETLSSLRQSANLRPFFVSLCMQCALHFSGVAPLLFFSVQFFTDAGTSVDASLSSIIVASITVVTVVLTGVFAANASRRRIMLMSQAGVVLCHISMAVYFALKDQDLAQGIRWLPLANLVAFFFVFNFGLASFVWIVTAEVLPPPIRSSVNSIAIFFGAFLFFIITYFFQDMFVIFGGMGLFSFYGATSFLFLMTSFFFLPETKEKTTEEIASFFLNYQFPFYNSRNK